MEPEIEGPITRRFVPEVLVARGAFGEVYRGNDRESGAQVAIKRLLGEHASGSTVVTRFAREAKILGQIDSPHVVRCLGFGADADGRPCLVLEWLEGVDLSARLGQGALTPAQAVEVARQAALGLAALHEAGIVHRDVKPSNFLVWIDPEATNPLQGVRVKLIDLGIAQVPTDPTLTAAGTTIGTPAYMSPEQARGEEDLTPRSDLFSLGSVLYEMIAGRRAFGGDHPFVVLAKIVLEDPPALASSVPGIPRELAELVGKALAKTPDRRFSSAREMARALEAVPIEPELEAVLQGDTPTAEIRLARVSVSAEQRVVTAVFASFAGTREPNRAMQVFTRLAAENGAVSHRTLGERMIAVLGAERTSGDEPTRAARLALGAAARIPGVLVAIATGRAVSGAAGLSGEAIERGARDVERAGRAVRVDPVTARLLGEQFVVEGDEDALVLRGERANLEVSRTLLGKPTRCHGRDREIGTLELIFDECTSEPVARVVLLTAPAGGGKSRVRHEFIKRLEERAESARAGSSVARPEVLFGRGDPLGVGSPFAMIGGAIRRAAGILDGEPPAEQRDKLRARIARFVRPDDVDRVAALIGELVSVPFPEDASTALRAARGDAVRLGDAMRAAWLEWLQSECAAHPVLLVLEDMHWGDLPTVKFVDAALRALREAPFMVLALARPELDQKFPELWSEGELLRMRLGELRPRACERIVYDVLGEGVSEDSVKRIVERAQGNPFFLEELIRAVAEGAVGELPDTVLGMVQARLDALPAEARRVLRAASVFGRTFWQGGVLALLGGDPTTTLVRGALSELADREVATRAPSARFPGEVEYGFRHAIVRDAAYATLVDRDRALAHRLAGEWLERMGESDAMVLAEHFDRGGEPARAVQWYRRGAEQALEGNDLSAAIQRAERGAALCADSEMLGELRVIQATALRWRAEPSQAERFALEAAELLRKGSAAWFMAIREAIAASGRLGHVDTVMRMSDLASEAAAEPVAMSAQIAALCEGVIFLLIGARFEAATLLVERVEAITNSSTRSGAAEQRQITRSRAYLALFAGRLGEAVERFAASADAFERVNDARNASHMQGALGYVYCEIGEYARAEEVLRQGFATAERLGIGDVAAATLHNLGLALAGLGRTREARQVEERAAERYRGQREPRLESGSRLYLAAIALADKDFARAEVEARRSHEIAAAAPSMRAAALGALALALLAQNRIDEARDTARIAAEGLASGFVEHESFARLAVAETLEGVGDRAGAVRAIRDARARIMARAQRFDDEALRESFLRRVTEHRRTLELAEEWGA